MKNTIFAAAVGTAMATNALANDFNTAGITFSANHGIFNFQVEGTVNNGFDRVGVGAQVFSFGGTHNMNSTIDLYGSYYRNTDEFSVGAVSSVTYDLGSVALSAAGEVEYFTNSQSWHVTPTVGASYNINSFASVFGEVGYSWNASDRWSRLGGVAELGVNFALADNMTVSPSVRYRFDENGVANNAQAHLGITFNF